MATVAGLDCLCRLCATKMDNLMGLPIFEENEQSKNIDKKISACLPVQVSMEDQLPKVICAECAFKIDDLFDFREKVLQTENMFIQMLKSLPKPDIHCSNKILINVIQESLNGQILDATQSSNDTQHDIQNSIHALPVLNGVELTNGQQVMQTEISRDENEVDVFQLDKETARIFDEQMKELKVTNQEITIHLESGEMSINLGQIDINYVTSMTTDSPPTNHHHHLHHKQISSYCDDEDIASTKLEDDLVVCKSLVSEEIDSQEEHENGDHLNGGAFELPSTSHIIKSDEEHQQQQQLIVQYTKSARDELIASAVNNPSMDESESPWYICPFCNDVAADVKYFVEHFTQHFCSCPSCEIYFTSVEALNIHSQSCVQTKLEDDGRLEEDSSSAKEQPKQTNSRSKGTPKVCPTCGKQYRTNYKLQEHMRKHTGEKPYQCTHCNKSFRSKIGLAQHTATHTGQFDYSCSICSKGFSCKSYLIVHQRVHSDLKPYCCSTCSQTFKTKQSLLDHENRHAGVKPYKCEICGRQFITKGLCKSHEKIHSGLDNRQYPCPICKRRFVSKSYLATHALIHTGDKPYLCECCGKGFLTKMDLKIHMTMHTGEKNFKCDVCSKSFARQSALRCHKRSHTGERPYRCDACGKTFTQFSPMAIHKRLHTGERPYECDLCGKTFVSKSTMMGHRKKHDNANQVPSEVKKSGKENSELSEREQEKDIKLSKQDDEVPAVMD